MMQVIQKRSDGIIMRIAVQPKSSKNMIAGIHGDAIKIKLTAPPADNAANKMCIEYIADWLSVPKSRVEILSGQTGRKKNILIRCLDESSIQAIIHKIHQTLIGD